MYYAACCCNGGAPVCGCGDYAYASVSFAHAIRIISPIVYQALCDRPCRQGHALAESAVTTYYVEAKVYMRCGGTGGTDGVYQTDQMLPQFQKFDPDSIKVLYTLQANLIETNYRPTITDCCEPPFQSLICFETGQQTRIRRTTGTLLPFDVLNPDGGVCARVNPGGSTYVARGDEFGGGAPDVVTNQPNKYFRRTQVSMNWSLLAQKNSYRQDYDGSVEESTTTELVGGGFGCDGITQTVERWSIIGDECDSHAIGTEVATRGKRSVGSAFEDLPWTDYLNIADDNVECNATTYFASCCDPLNVPYPATSGTIDYTIGSEQDGGVFNLEFMDEPPPPAP